MKRLDRDESRDADYTDDAFLGGALSILQPKAGYRAGIDAVLLAAAAPSVKPSERVLDAGAGVGVVGLCMAARIPDAHVTLAEVEPQLVALARENIAHNKLEARVDVVAANMLAPAQALSTLGLAAGSFAHIVTNPPFYEEGRGRPSKIAIKARAHAMPSGALERWVRALTRLSATRGSLTIIHRAEALGELLALLRGRFGALKVLPIHPRPEVPAVRIILQGWKGSRAPLTLLPGLILHEEGNGFRPQVSNILRRGASLPLSLKA